MKALPIAALFALGLAGTACSQTSDAEDATPATETSAQADNVGGSFNLGLPADLETASAPANDGFNLALPGTEAANTDGFNLGTDVAASSGLADLPEIATPLADDADALELELPETEETDDEPIIRLE